MIVMAHSEEQKIKHRDVMRRWREKNYKKAQLQGYESAKRSRLSKRIPCPKCGVLMKHTAKFCMKCCTGDQHPAWKGGKYLDAAGYVLVMGLPNECGLTKNGYIREHRRVMQEILGRPLFKDETVHHKNGIRADNRPENLELWASRQPAGQRVADLLEYAEMIIKTYKRRERW